MENVSEGNKRKRLRTRKNLDELRRKFRREHENSTKNPKRKQGKLLYKPNKLITSQRLTLAMFKKSVQSKTILRSESNETNNNIMGNKKELRPESYNTNDEQLFKKHTYSPTQNKLNDIEEQCLSPDRNGYNSPPPISLEVHTCCGRMGEYFSPTFLSHIYERENNMPNIYDNLNSNLNTRRNYLNEFHGVFNFISENIVPDILDDDLGSIFENYNNFVRERRLMEHENEVETTPQASEINETSTSSEYVTNEHIDDAVSLNESTPVNLEISFIVDDTPEYKYYPHKLNQ